MLTKIRKIIAQFQIKPTSISKVLISLSSKILSCSFLSQKLRQQSTIFIKSQLYGTTFYLEINKLSHSLNNYYKKERFSWRAFNKAQVCNRQYQRLKSNKDPIKAFQATPETKNQGQSNIILCMFWRSLFSYFSIYNRKTSHVS